MPFRQLAYTILVISMHSLWKGVLRSLLLHSSTHLLYTVLCPLIALHPFPLPCTLYTVLYLLRGSYSPSTLLYSLTLSCMALHCPAPFTLSCISSHLLTLSCTPSHCPVLPYTALYSLHCLILLPTVLNSLTLSCTPLHCSVPLYTPALPCSLYSAIIPISMSHTLLCPLPSIVLLLIPLALCSTTLCPTHLFTQIHTSMYTLQAEIHI